MAAKDEITWGGGGGGALNYILYIYAQTCLSYTFKRECTIKKDYTMKRIHLKGTKHTKNHTLEVQA